MTKIDAAAAAYLESLKAEGMYRWLQNTHALLDFHSNDYLGLGHDLEFSTKLISFIQERSTSGLTVLSASTGSRLISGNSDEIAEFESYLSKFFGGASALFFSSGYLANLALINAFGFLDATFYYDEFVHASQRDALKLTRAQTYSFRHQDFHHLSQRVINLDASKPAVIMVESLYSMAGDYFDFEHYKNHFPQREHHLVMDAAHTGGLSGFRLGRQVISPLGTLSSVDDEGRKNSTTKKNHSGGAIRV